MTTETLGQYIRAARIRQDMAMRHLAELCETSPSYLSDVENGKRLPSQRLLEQLPLYIDVDLDQMTELGGGLDRDMRLWLERTPYARRLVRRIMESQLTPAQVLARLELS